MTNRQALSGRRPVHRLSGTILVLAVSIALAACADTKFLSVLPTILTDTLPTSSSLPDRNDAAAPALPTPQTGAVLSMPDVAAPRGIDPLPQPEVKPPVLMPPEIEAAAPAPEITPPPPPAPEVALKAPVIGVDGPVRVALLLPLSGPSAALGESLLNAALMALHDVGDERLMLLPRDTQGLPEGAIDAIEQGVADGAQIILGPVFSASVQAAAQVTRSVALNMIAFSTDRSVAGDGVYLIGFMPEQQVDRVVSFAVRQGLQRFAAVIPATAYGETVAGTMQNVAVREGAAIARIEVLAGGPDSFQDSVRDLADYEARRNELAAVRAELRARDDEVSRRTLDRLEGRDTVSIVGFDAVMLAEGGDRLRALAPLLPFYDVDPARVRFLGTGLWDEPSLGREPSLVGGWFAGPDPKAGKGFRTRYQQLYGKLPPRIASLAYDATALAAVLARTRPQPYYESSALINPAGFSGIDGIFRFATSGISERGLAVLEVRPDGLRVVSPAPVSFDPPTN